MLSSDSHPYKLILSGLELHCTLASERGVLDRASAFRQEIPGLNPVAAPKSCEVCPGLGILQPQWNPYLSLTWPLNETRHYTLMCGPQYG